jgi:hypothetical protein
MEKYPRMFEITIFILVISGMALYFRYCASDAAEVWQLGSQDPATPLVEGMLHFHNYLMIF